MARRKSACPRQWPLSRNPIGPAKGIEIERVAPVT
jgi:hypothetical protein